MKIISAFSSGLFRSVKSWKGAVIIWFLSLILVSLMVIPLKGELISGFGKSMITEKLSDSFNIEVFTDLGPLLASLTSSFSSGFFFTVLVGFIMNAFLTGGLFNSLSKPSVAVTPSEFFGAAARNFRAFLIITFIISVIIFFMTILIIFIPAMIVVRSETSSESLVFSVIIISGSVFLLLVMILFLIADNARTWQVKHDRSSGFRALGFGFRQTCRTFLSAYSLMIFIMIVQVIFGYLVFKILIALKPVSGGGVFLLFIISQLLFFIKVMLKAWRYGCVISLAEIELKKAETDLLIITYNI